MQNSSNEIISKGTIMIVEQNDELLTMMKRFFSKHYFLLGYKNDRAAIEILKKGLKPEMIIADASTESGPGGQFLATTIYLSPNSIRVVLIDDSAPKKIIPIINQAKTYMFLLKPVGEMEIVQAVRLCFTHYKMQAINRQQQQENKKLSDSLAFASLTARNNSPANFMSVVNASAASFKSLYFVDFAGTCENIVRQMELSALIGEAVISCINVFMFVMNFMPERFRLSDPETLSVEEKTKYFVHWKATLTSIEQFDAPAVRILSQIWENYDGTGYPLGLSSTSILIEAQVLKIVFLYINFVFRIPIDVFLNRNSVSEFKQPLAETTRRHKQFTKILFDRAKWFYPALVDKYRFMFQDKHNDAFDYSRHDLTIINCDYVQPIPEEKLVAPQKPIEPITEKNEKVISITQLREGMIFATDLVAKSGLTVIKAGSTATQQNISKILYLDHNDQLSGDGTIEILFHQPIVNI